ncbi:hypothetical protein UFOVP247_28 [uncultured Caudovirales phage]|uniref:Uncharacterized protein n=1 Tax=uncultured Caudovirales phage TaxID=2100421 RepID=A0A6J7X0F0_9CAUD|nr:hypothetical protein UFOVP247_28 [uncultured Caudovirales phage]
MNKLLITVAAAAAFTTAAHATDLPSKASAPAAAQASAASVNTLTAGYGYEFDAGDYDASTATTYSVSFDHSLGGGFSIGAAAGTSQAAGEGALKQTIEATGSFKQPLIAGFTGKVGGSVGERFTDGADYAFYTLNAGLDYKVSDSLTLNALGYRYRNTFDTAAYSWESHQISTGATFNIMKDHAVFVKLARSYDADFSAATTDAVTVGYKLSF